MQVQIRSIPKHANRMHLSNLNAKAGKPSDELLSDAEVLESPFVADVWLHHE